MKDGLLENAQVFLPWMPIITLMFGLLTFCVGHVVGHRSAVRRDKRKEYNTLVSPVRVKLLKQIDAISSGGYIKANISKDEILLISEQYRKPSKVTSCFTEYEHANSWEGLKCKNVRGIVEINDKSPALEAARKLLKLMPLK